MEEKILVEGKPSAKTIPMVLIGASLFVFLLGVIIDWSPSERLVPYLISTAVLIAGIVLYFAWRVSSITVSNKRVYGKALFGSRVDIPYFHLQKAISFLLYKLFLYIYLSRLYKDIQLP